MKFLPTQKLPHRFTISNQYTTYKHTEYIGNLPLQMPLMGFLISRLAGLPLPYAIGISLVASCPGGTASNVVSYIAKADVTLSVAMTAASTFGAVLATPLLSKLLIGQLVPVDAVGLLLSTVQVGGRVYLYYSITHVFLYYYWRCKLPHRRYSHSNQYCRWYCCQSCWDTS